jgi:hypothetical protein
VNGDARNVRAGDILLCSAKDSLLSAGIRWLTRSQSSHAALVTAADPNGGDFLCLEVGSRIRVAPISDYPTREWIAYRPRVLGLPLTPLAGQKIARDLLSLLSAGGVLGALYPWWKLVAYVLGRDWRGHLLLSGPRQVCSVTTIRAAVAHGVEVWVWDGSNRCQLLTADEIESITPADLLHNAVEQGWEPIAWTGEAPVI